MTEFETSQNLLARTCSKENKEKKITHKISRSKFPVALKILSAVSSTQARWGKNEQKGNRSRPIVSVFMQASTPTWKREILGKCVLYWKSPGWDEARDRRGFLSEKKDTEEDIVTFIVTGFFKIFYDSSIVFFAKTLSVDVLQLYWR